MARKIRLETLYEARKVIGEHIRELREEKSLTQAELGEIVGVSQTTIAKIENGVFNFGIDTVSALSVALDFYTFFIPKDSNDELAVQMRERWKRKSDEN